ncbi:MAG: tRNA pseudouridine(55) synthase TruB, partial [Bacilli bacterium]|nr:tRNA pseudouridine(55) synthase TruB [Bacilli bacterium]
MKDGILFVDKDAGMTSRQVDNAIQRLFHTRKVGHLGTLDPFATGLLIVSLGKGGKFL